MAAQRKGNAAFDTQQTKKYNYHILEYIICSDLLATYLVSAKPSYYMGNAQDELSPFEQLFPIRID